jgi:hypothetical protein
MLANLMQSDFGVAVAMFHAIKSQDRQRSAIQGAAEKVLPTEDFKLLRLSGKHRPPLAIADMNTQATEHVSEPGLRIDIVEPGGSVAATHASGQNRGDVGIFEKSTRGPGPAGAPVTRDPVP